MHSLNPITLTGVKPSQSNSRYGYAAASIIREVALNSENLRNWAILDSGASSHFLLSKAPVVNKKIAETPLTVTLPNGDIVSSSHIAELNLPLLPKAARTAHVVPGLASHSLVSVVKLCNAGCEVDVRDIACTIRYRGKTIVRCSKCTRTGLWMMPLTNVIEDENPEKDLDPVKNVANHAQQTTSKPELAQYHHQSLFSPSVVTLQKAINNHQLDSFPGLETDLLKHLPTSTATLKGHMHKNRKGLRSTHSDQKEIEMARKHLADMNPPELVCATLEPNVFCYAALADSVTGTIYTDLPGKFPVQSIRNMQYIFVCYAYESNAILVRPMKNRSDESFVAAYKDIYEYLESKGFKPTLNVTDNECSKAVQDYINSQKVDWQLVEPNNHRVNAAERAIQTFKNHFISGLCSVDKLFPLQLWCYLLAQAELTLNLLRTSRIDPTKSAYEVLEGTFKYNSTPLAPPGTKALIFEPTSRRTAWGPHAVDGWYLGPAMKHYRCS